MHHRILHREEDVAEGPGDHRGRDIGLCRTEFRQAGQRVIGRVPPDQRREVDVAQVGGAELRPQPFGPRMRKAAAKRTKAVTRAATLGEFRMAADYPACVMPAQAGIPLPCGSASARSTQVITSKSMI